MQKNIYAWNMWKVTVINGSPHLDILDILEKKFRDPPRWEGDIEWGSVA